MVRKYDKLNETVYKKKLDSGLDVIVIPKIGYKRTFAVFATKYGSHTNKFIPYGEKEFLEVPLGIAHFLEHKLFEMPNGDDATQLFANLGLDSNAATSYNMTAYLFSGTQNIEAGLNLLLDFVQTPYFTKESVLKEQGIIEQELKMYLDSPSDALQLGLMNNLFKEYPLIHDIGGTVESIKEINEELLYKCYNTFYHPSNMYLVFVGDPNQVGEGYSVDDIFKIIESNQKSKEFPVKRDIKKEIITEDGVVNIKSGSYTMDISMARAAVGLKLPYENYQINDPMLLELKLKILLEATLGPTTDAFQEMLDLNLISGNIGYDVYTDSICGYIKIYANTHKPDEFVLYIKNKLLSLKNIEMTEEVFNRFKKSFLGSFLKALNSLDFIAYSYLEYITKDSDIFQVIDLIEPITIADLKKLEKYFHEDAIADYIIYPKNNL